MKKGLLFLLLSVMGISAGADDLIPTVSDISSYSGTAPYVYNEADSKYYVRNNSSYEVYGIYEKVTATVINYIATDASHQTYINTGYIHKANTRIVADIEMTDDGDGWQAVFGARKGSYNTNAFVLFSTANHNGNHNGVFNRSGAETDFNNNIPANERIIIDASGQTATVKKQSDNSTIATATTTGTANEGVNPMFIFNTNTSGDAGGVSPDGSYNKMKLYNFKIYEGDVLVHDYVPVATNIGKGGLMDNLTGAILLSAKSDVDFVKSSDASVISSYKGKMAVNLGEMKVYRYNGTSYVEVGSLTLGSSISDTDYKNMKNWRCPDDHWATVFGSGDKIAYNEEAGTNSFNPYEGNGGWEPLHRTIPVEANAYYNVSFKYSTSGWNTWNTNHSETPDPISLPFKIIDRESYSQNLGFYTDAGLIAYAKLTNQAVTNQDISVNFTSTTNVARFIIQFGVVDDGSHTPAYTFSFDKWDVKKYNYPVSYPDLGVLIQTINFVKEHGVNTSDAETALQAYDLDGAKNAAINAFKWSKGETSPQPTIFTMVSESVVGTDDNDRGIVVTNHDDGFYVYNVGTGRWFCGGDAWGAHAAVGFPGIKVTTPENNYGSGQYNSVKTWLFNGNWNAGGLLNHSGYCDTDGNGWKFWRQDAEHGIFTWARNGNDSGNNTGLGCGTQGLVGFAPSTYARVNTDRTGADNPYNQWIFVTEAQRDAMANDAKATASEANPVDLTYKIKMPGFNQRERKEGENQSSDVLDWTCNHANYRYNGTQNPDRLLINERGADHADFVCDVYGDQWRDAFSLTQTVTGLTPGRYRVKVQGYNNGGDAVNKAYLEANGQKATLVDISSESVLPWTTRLPGATFEAPEYFQAGCYWNSVLCTVGSDGELELGVKSPSVTGAHVIIFDNFRLEYVGLVGATIGDADYTTFVAPYDIDTMPSGVEAYACQVGTNYVHLEPVTAIPEGEAVVLKNEGTYKFSPASGSVSLGTSNDLQASNGNVTGAAGNVYALAKKNGEVGFYRVGDDVTVPAGKGYLQISSGSGVKAFYGFDEDDATSINEELRVKNEESEAVIYNIAGQRLSKVQKGINIINGKKTLK